MKKNTSKKLARLFATFLSCATLFVPMTVLSCKQAVKTATVEETLPLKEGKMDWNKFLELAREEKNENNTKTYKFKEFPNSNELKGFSGIAIYEDLLTVLLDSIYGSRLYDTTGLKLYFKDIEITPTIIETLLNKISKLNISNENSKGEISPVKMSSKNKDGKIENFDVDKYEKYLKDGKITINDSAEVIKSADFLLGTKNVDEQNTKITDKDKVLYLINSKLFKSAQLHILNFDGNLFDVMKILNKESAANNIKFTKQSFFAAKLKDNELDFKTVKQLYEIPVDYIKEMKTRGSNVNLENLQIKGLGFDAATGFDLKDSSFKNVYFANYNNLKDIDLSRVDMKGLVIISCQLPSKMEYANIDGKLVLKEAFSDATNGTLLTASYIKDLEIINMTGIENLKIADNNKGQIDKLKGKKSDYETLVKIFNIDKNNLDLIVPYMINIQKTRG